MNHCARQATKNDFSTTSFPSLREYPYVCQSPLSAFTAIRHMKIHFIAIGGSIMHSLAIALAKNGHVVTGSDDQIFDPARSRLASFGLLPAEEGWNADRITSEVDVVILGMHAFADNPELQKAQELNLPIYSFPAFVFEQCKEKQRIVIAGSAGKTTVTAMILHVLNGVGKDVDYLVGAQIEGIDNPVKISEDAPAIVIEGDEYLSSKLDPRPKFLHYLPHMLVLTNISWDHINVFPTEDIYLAQFETLLKQLKKAADVIYFEEDAQVQQLIEAHTDENLHYLHPYKVPSYKVSKEGFEIKLHGERQLVQVIGAHNMANIAAAWKACELLGVQLEDFLGQIATFRGAGIRLEVKHESEDLVIIRDYAHAPNKVEASVKAVKERYPHHHVVAVYELHTFSSLNQAFLPAYAHSLDQADTPMVFVNPAALLKRRLPPLEPAYVQTAFQHPQLTVLQEKETLLASLKKAQKGRTVYLLMSSGNLGGIDPMNLAK